MTAPHKKLEKTSLVYPVSLSGQVSFSVSEGDKIGAGEELAVIVQRDEQEIDLAELTGRKGRKTLDCLVKQIGDSVEKGELLACKKSLMDRKEIFSPLNGVIESVSENGLIKISSSSETRVKSEFAGEIKSVKDDKIEIKTEVIKLSGKWGKGGRSAGKLHIIEADNDKEAFFKLEKNVAGKILFSFIPVNHAFWFKALSLGAAGVISGFFNEEGADWLNSQPPDNFCPIPLLVSADEVINEDDREMINRYNGHYCLIDANESELIIPIK